MNERLLDPVIERLREGGPRSWPEISKLSGVPLSTLQHIVHGHTPNPRVRTVEALAGALIDKELSGAP